MRHTDKIHRSGDDCEDTGPGARQQDANPVSNEDVRIPETGEQQECADHHQQHQVRPQDGEQAAHGIGRRVPGNGERDQGGADGGDNRQGGEIDRPWGAVAAQCRGASEDQ